MTLPKFDVIVTWPRNADYPVWRKFLRDNRAGFNDVFIVYMQPNQGHNYMPFVIEATDQDRVANILSPHLQPGEDWRSVAVNTALEHSKAEWVWFTEQDFYPKPGFWDDVAKAIEDGCDVVGVLDGDRLHPCSLMIKRSMLDQTSKNFGVIPNRGDHFGIIQTDLAVLHAKTAIISADRYKHYAGMSHNWRLLSDGIEPNYKKEEFLGYLKESLECGIELEPTWEEIAFLALTK